ncbi:MAG: hypothetical protein IKS45_06725 [Thermoguttaceae bacterium]|nr:hypothetical protein [Thermoguttaceae bacterium]
MKKPLLKVARAKSRGDWNLTDSVRALNLRDICDSQNLGEQFGEQTAILEQIIDLFDRLEADKQAALLEVLQGRIQTPAE